MFIHKMGKKEKLEGTLPRSSNSAVSSMDVTSDSSPMCRNTSTWIPCGSASSDWLSQSVASSTSWSDELDADATRSLQEQWRIVEGTLYRDADPDLQLPANSPLRDECRLWQKHFPHLRVLGNAIRPSVACQTRSRHEEAEEQIEEIIAAHGDFDTDRSNKIESLKEDTSDNEEMYKEKLKKAVIDQIFTRIWPEVFKKIEPILLRAADNRKIIFSDSPELKWQCNDRISDEVPRQFNSLSIAEDLSLASIRPKSERSVLSARNCNDSLNDVMTREFNSLTITEDNSSTNVRPRSGRTVLSARKNASALLPVKPVVLECQIPLPNSATVRISSAVRKSPVRLSQPSLQLKHISPERLLSPLVLQPEVKTTLKSAGSRKFKTNERKQETRHYPQYDAKTGRMISCDDSRSGLRRNLKTSPPIPMPRHVTLPPIETCEIFPKLLDNAVQYSRSTRSSSAFLRGGRLSHSSRPTSKARCFS